MEYGGLANLNYVDSPVPFGSFIAASETDCAESCNSRGAGCRGFVYDTNVGQCTLFTAGARGALPNAAYLGAYTVSAVQATNGIATLPQTLVSGPIPVASGASTFDQCQSRCMANTGGNCYFAYFNNVNGFCVSFSSGEVSLAQPQAGCTSLIKANVNYTTL